MVRFTALASIALVILTGCPKASQEASSEVVVYCAVDETFAQQVLSRFEAQSGAKVQAVYDTEAGKTTGLVKRIRAESGSPRADVWFSGELFQTIELARDGLLTPYESPDAADIPDRYKDGDHRWTAIGLRGRVLVYDSGRTGEADLPATWRELADEKFASKLAIANPMFGTTRSHVAAMFAAWGEPAGREFLTGLREGGAQMVDGNSFVVRAVMAGDAAYGMTDTDDVIVARRQHPSLQMRYLDMGDGGTLWIPSSVGLIKGCPHPDAAGKLVDFLVSAQVERTLAESDSGNIPVRPGLRSELHMDLPPSTSLEYDRIAEQMQPSFAAIREILIH